MKRYEITKLKLDKSGVRVYGTTYYPRIPIKNSDQFIYTRVGDRLDNLAHKYYQDNTLWWILAKANGIKGKIALKPSILLRIPGDIMGILEKFEDLNQR
tara:strand:- start:286 stop:582 length:297 start_codon:yes stop_codon:yes gene_type:complete